MEDIGAGPPRSFRQLLDAVITIGADLDLLTVLQHIVDAATSLADARYGALGVLDPTRTFLTDFLTVGLDEETRAEHRRAAQGSRDPRPAHRRSPATSPPRPPSPSRQLRLPAGPSADAVVPRRHRDRAGGGVREPLPHRQAVTGRVQRSGRGAPRGVRHGRGHRHRQRPPARQPLRAGIAAGPRAHRDGSARHGHPTAVRGRPVAPGHAAPGGRIPTSRCASRPRCRTSTTTIKQIRTTIFDLDAPARSGGVRERLLALVSEVSPSLPATPAVVFEGPIEVGRRRGDAPTSSSPSCARRCRTWPGTRERPGSMWR